ncbi:tRNA (uridine(34)/cytosine(34)/5-carboxymethylaminomethyluridine(34)-2'-O)-methyltransferase TrmL [Shimazuella kribbensis]|uniref:tRNA (uridine(34)/cytosine(34)/5- carboxymethylaminomethyluridine(34)-2'-O)- methyltransferase TrmL n=1 Tax=Shimazuella kribbensis TaxID=139808 RepID=UPI0004102D26|nr:tRNA (uridine(34)/cytosine(34)/5-carboxymethylaminomethyluridine(34)-2'-O)-methyltransferase TrmL [Shimazuella kribbensis]
MPFHIVLVEPEIPPNTGNIVRTCSVTGAKLHLIKPLGFSIDDTQLKRAGLDYWYDLNIQMYDSFQELREKFPDNRFFCATTKAQNSYAAFSYREGDFFVFGKETKGLDESILKANKESLIRVPMLPDVRSLNLANSVAIVLYEGLRQLEFPGLR